MCLFNLLFLFLSICKPILSYFYKFSRTPLIRNLWDIENREICFFHSKGSNCSKQRCNGGNTVFRGETVRLEIVFKISWRRLQFLIDEIFV